MMDLTGRSIWQRRSTCTPIRSLFFSWQRPLNRGPSVSQAEDQSGAGVSGRRRVVGALRPRAAHPQYSWVDWLTFTNRKAHPVLPNSASSSCSSLSVSSCPGSAFASCAGWSSASAPFRCCSAPRPQPLAYRFVTYLTGAALVGLAFALSSTAIVIPVMAEQKRLNTPPDAPPFRR